ncbi:hypothetical protein J6A31_08950 [bacterium]|nr:hypothetical protein [bacterium]
MGKHIWGYWDCEYCGHKKHRADKEECPNCGSPRSKDTKFYMDLSTKEYVSESEKNTKANWICSFCNSQNEDYESECEYCGASKSDSELNYLELKRRRRNNMSVTKFNLTKTTSNPISNEKEPHFNTAKIKHISINALKFTAIGLAFIAIIAFFVWLAIPVEREMTIEGFEWSRNIQIEELKTFDESGWSLPSGARLHRTSEEIRRYDHVIDYYETKTIKVQKERIAGYEEYVSGYRDLGNGQFEEIISKRPIYETYYETETVQEPVYKDVPVYDTKYYYEIDRWVDSRNVRTSGYDKNPKWGTVTLADKERQGNKTEIYYICGTIDGSPQKFNLAFAQWNNCNEGDRLIFTTSKIGNSILEIKDVISEKPAA